MCMYHTGMDPFTKKPVYVARHLRDRKLQRALMQCFKPENYFEVRKALEQAGRAVEGNGVRSVPPPIFFIFPPGQRPPAAAGERRLFRHRLAVK
jgi:Domain of unknown function (DUF3362)